MPADFDYTILGQVAHRPWPMRDAPWVMTQTWHDLLFAHWPVDAATIGARVPSSIPLDTFERRAWLGIVPFHMTNVALRASPGVPTASAFPELNVRTYVRIGDKPGVYFFSLDAGSAIAVHAARMLLGLPYYAAAMEVTRDGDTIRYRSSRAGARLRAEFVGAYRPSGEAFQAEVGSLEYFLTERYCLYHLDGSGRPVRLDIHHPPWRLQRAEATIDVNTMADVNGIALPPTAPLLHFAKRQDTVAWLPTRPD